jgi:hypothetical protein
MKNISWIFNLYMCSKKTWAKHVKLDVDRWRELLVEWKRWITEKLWGIVCYHTLVCTCLGFGCCSSSTTILNMLRSWWDTCSASQYQPAELLSSSQYLSSCLFKAKISTLLSIYGWNWKSYFSVGISATPASSFRQSGNLWPWSSLCKRVRH